MQFRESLRRGVRYRQASGAGLILARKSYGFARYAGFPREALASTTRSNSESISNMNRVRRRCPSLARFTPTQDSKLGRAGPSSNNLKLTHVGSPRAVNRTQEDIHAAVLSRFRFPDHDRLRPICSAACDL